MFNFYSHTTNTRICENQKDKISSFTFLESFVYHTTSFLGGARCVIIIFVGNGHGDQSSNPG